MELESQRQIPPERQSGGSSSAEIGEAQSSTFRCGYVAIVGKPNVGKSTLLNSFLNQKISIVSPKPQTTRHKVIGLLSTESSQVIFLDTPGLIRPKYLLQEFMMDHALSAMADADLVLMMIDATKWDRNGNDVGDLPWLRDLRQPVYLVINKVDLVHKPEILPMIESYSRVYAFREIFPISALKRDNTDALLSSIVSALPVHPPYYPLDIVSEQSERFFVSEIVREKIFVLCREEVPYSTTVRIIEFKEKEEGKTLIRAEIIVSRDSQRGIIIGREGVMVKRIGEESRKEIETFLQRPAYLDLHVKVYREWREKKHMLEKLGYK
jgi:GTP-binding protein Era